MKLRIFLGSVMILLMFAIPHYLEGLPQTYILYGGSSKSPDSQRFTCNRVIPLDVGHQTNITVSCMTVSYEHEVEILKFLSILFFFQKTQNSLRKFESPSGLVEICTSPPSSEHSCFKVCESLDGKFVGDGAIKQIINDKIIFVEAMSERSVGGLQYIESSLEINTDARMGFVDIGAHQNSFEFCLFAISAKTFKYIAQRADFFNQSFACIRTKCVSAGCDVCFYCSQLSSTPRQINLYVSFHVRYMMLILPYKSTILKSFGFSDLLSLPPIVIALGICILSANCLLGNFGLLRGYFFRRKERRIAKRRHESVLDSLSISSIPGFRDEKTITADQDQKIGKTSEKFLSVGVRVGIFKHPFGVANWISEFVRMFFIKANNRIEFLQFCFKLWGIISLELKSEVDPNLEENTSRGG